MTVAAVVTGVGLHTCVGDGASLLEAWLGGTCAVAMHTLPEIEGFPAFPAAPAAPAAPTRFLPDRKLEKYMSEVSRLAVLAAGRALESAALLDHPERRAPMGLYLATGPMAFDLDTVLPSLESCVSAQGTLESERLGEGLRRCHPLMPFKMLLNMPLGLTSIIFGMRGENAIAYPGAAQAGAAFEAGLRDLAAGRCERVLVGAAVQGVSLLPVSSLARAGLLASSREAFLAGEGLAPADGAACLVLESERAAAGRGARPLCTIGGAASGLALAREPAERAREAVAVWTRPLAEEPAEVLAGALGSQAEDGARRQALARRFPAAHLAPSLDLVCGSLGAAALAVCAALTALRLAAGAAKGPVLVATLDADGGAASVVLR